MEGELIESSNPQNTSEPPKAEQKKDKTRVFAAPLPPMPRRIPDREEFNAYISEYCPWVEDRNPDIYDEWLKNNWHIWNRKAKAWGAIFDWRKTLEGRESKLERDITKASR